MNIKELAKIVNLSVTTTSRALNDHASVTKATRKRVQAAAQKHGYAPNLSARSLQSGKTGNIGIVFPFYHDNGHTSSAVLAEFIAALSHYLHQNDYSLVVNMADDGLSDSSSWQKMIINKHVDGIIVPRLEVGDIRIPWLEQRNFPFVVFGHPGQAVNYPWFDLDHEKAFYDAVMYLNGLGHTKIACIAGSPKLMLTQQRIAGYQKAMATLNLEKEAATRITYAAMNEAGGVKAFSALYAHPTAPTAVVCVNDLQAFGVMKRAQEYGLTIGKDLSVIGYDDLSLSAYWQPALTTFHQPVTAAAEKLANMIYARLNGNEQPYTQELWKAQMVMRQSCGAPNE